MAPTVLVMMDGLRPDALAEVNTPNVDRLRARGATSLSAQSVVPSYTLPCHMSIFHSVPPSRHGIMTNQWQPMARPLPGLVDQAKVAGRRCYFFHNWEPLRDLNRPETLHFSYFRNNPYTKEGDLVNAEVAAQYIRSDVPDFAFVYFSSVDVSGHNHGWMSDEYLAQIERVDQAVGMVLDALTAESTILLQSDHGGHERVHGTDLPEDVTIPWIIAGPGIRQGYEIQSRVSLLDTAPTLAHILEVPVGGEWEGRCVEEIFQSPSE